MKFFSGYLEIQNDFVRRGSATISFLDSDFRNNLDLGDAVLKDPVSFGERDESSQNLPVCTISMQKLTISDQGKNWTATADEWEISVDRSRSSTTNILVEWEVSDRTTFRRGAKAKLLEIAFLAILE